MSKCTLTLEFDSTEDLQAYLAGDQTTAPVKTTKKATKKKASKAAAKEPEPEPEPVVETEPEPVVEEPAGPSKDELIADVKRIYSEAIEAGVDGDLLNTTINAQLTKIGHPKSKLSDLSTPQLKQFHQGYSAHVLKTLVPGAKQAQSDVSSFV